MKIKKIFRKKREWSLHIYNKLLINICCIVFFCIIVLINPHYEVAEAKEPSEQLFISHEKENKSRGIHRLFRKEPTKEQGNYFSSFRYNRKQGLSSIAKEYGTNIFQILDLNALSSESVIPEDMLLYISSIPGRIIINDVVDQNFLDLTKSLHIYKTDSMTRYNHEEAENLHSLAYGAPIFVSQSLLDELHIDKEDIHSTDAELYQLTLAKYEEQLNKTSSNNVRNMANTRTSYSIRQPETAILKSRRPNIREDNGMTRGHCTYYAAHKAKFLFPEDKPGVRRRIIKGNANERLASAKKNGFKTKSTPSIGAVVVFKNGGGGFFSAGHVAIVESVNREEKSILISEMNYAGLGIVTERNISMNDAMTESTSNSQNIIGFIPVQELPKEVE